MMKVAVKQKYHILAFVIPMIILCLVFLCLFILIPNGNSVLISDLEAQYYPLLINLRNHGFELFSFQKGLGSNMIGTFAYYLASPFNFLIFLFPISKIDIAILIIIILKISLSGFTMFSFLKNEIDVKDKKYLLLFSTSYALMGFHVAYFFNILWLDATMILPIVILGINKLLEGKPKIYIFSLFYAILTNYYMGYMICIFCTLYFLYKTLLNYTWKKNKSVILKNLKSFIICSLLAVGMSLFLLLPSILELNLISKNNISPYASGLKISNFFDILSFVFMGARNKSNLISNDVYSLYFGTLNLILIFFYFFNKNISKKEKKISFIMIMIFVSSIFINYIDYIWNGFTATSSFSGRYIYLMTFFVIMISAKSFKNIKSIKIYNYLLFVIFFSLISIITMIQQYEYINNYILLAQNGLVLFYLFILYCLPRLSLKKKILTLLILLLTFGELFFNFYISIRTYRFMTRKEVEDNYNILNKKLDKIKKNDKDFYRIVKDYNMFINDGFIYDIPVAAHFLSTIHNKSLTFLGYTSYTIGTNFIYYHMPSNPIIDSMIGNKYHLFRYSKPENYEEIDHYSISETKYEYYGLMKARVNIYKKPYVFSLGNLVDEKTGTCNLDFYDESLDRIKFQNDMVSCLSGTTSNIFEKINFEKIDKNKFKIIANGKHIMYLVPKIDFNYDKIDNQVKLYMNGKPLYNYDEASFVISTFEFDLEKDTELIVELKNEDKPNEEYDLYAYYFNYDEYEKVFSDLSSEKMKILENNNGYIKGEVKVLDESKNYLFLNAEYTDEWEIKVDGKKVHYDEVFNTFIGLKLSKGKHTIEMKFHPKGFKLGIILSLLSLIVSIYYIRNRKAW